MSVWLARARQRQGAPPPPPPAVVRGPVPPPPPPTAPPPRVHAPPPPPPGVAQQPTSFWLAQAQQRTGETGPAAVVDEELARLLALPFIPEGTARCPDREGYAASLYNRCKPAGFKLREVQIDGAYTYEMYGGLLGPIGVGHGKTFLSLSIAMIGLRRRGHRRAVIMVPSEVYSQLRNRDLPEARRNLALDGIPFWFVEGGPSERMRTASQPGPGVFIYAYSSLSTQTGYDELCAICPTLYIMDEAHKLSRPNTARTKRFNSVANDIEKALKAGKLGPDISIRHLEAIALSGTITKKSTRDYAHLAKRALRENSPLPIKEQAIELFSNAMDADVQGANLSDLDRMRMDQIITWAGMNGLNPYEKATVHLTRQEATREAFQYRLRTSPGVVATGDQGVDCSLIISWSEPPRPATPEAEKMAALMVKVVNDMVTPDGDVIDYGMHTFKWLWELSAGFYNSLIWPTVPELRTHWVQKGKPISETEAEALIQGAKNHNTLLQAYHKLLRMFLDRIHIPGCDTPMLVAQEIVRQQEGQAARFRLPADLKDAYSQQRAAWYEDLPERKRVPVRICDYKVAAAVEWCRHHDPANKGPGGIVWFHHPEIGRWICERLKAEGIAHTYAPAGDNEAPFKSGLVISSYAHSTGKNLQHQSRNLVVEMRREASIMEQTLGRTHRSGQKADDVRADIFVCNGFDLALFGATMRDADYIQSTTGMRQRLCFATYAPLIPPTNPRLAYRLGIVAPNEEIRGAMTGAADAITAPEALDLNAVFRSALYSAA